MQKDKPEPKVTQKDFESAFESVISKIEANLQANKWVLTFRTLLDLTQLKNQNLNPASDRLTNYISQTLAKTYFYPTMAALLDNFKDASK